MTAIQYVKHLARHRLARNASWMILGQGANFFLQGAYFILLARLLGVTEYGLFAGAFALVNIVTPYSALGSSMLFMRYVSVDHARANVYWGNSLLVTFSISLVIACSLFFVGPILTNIHKGVLFVVLALASCLFGQISVLAGAVFQTFEKLRITAMLTFLSNLTRVLVLLFAKALLGYATALEWAVAVLIASVCTAAISLVWVQSEIGSAKSSLQLIRHRIFEGVGFSFAGTTQVVYNDVDKAMLSHYGLNRQNGFYTLAYRIVDFATTPIIAIESAIMPRFFQLSRQGMGKAMQLAAKAIGPTTAIGFVVAVAILLMSPVVPYLVGREFADVITALRWLCCIPLLRGIQQISGGVLTGSGRQNFRTVAQFLVAVINLLLNFLWIPTHGWIGAAWSSVVSDGMLAALNSVLLLWFWLKVARHGELTHADANDGPHLRQTQ